MDKTGPVCLVVGSKSIDTTCMLPFYAIGTKKRMDDAGDHRKLSTKVLFLNL